MSNVTEHKITASFSAADITAITNALTLVYSKLPQISLTDDQRLKLKSIDVSNKIFVEDTIVEMGLFGSASIIPGYVSQASMQVNLTMFQQIDAIESQVNSLLRKLSDCKRVAGDDVYSSALVVYDAISTAHRTGGINAKSSYDKLKARFESQGYAGRTSTPNP